MVDRMVKDVGGTHGRWDDISQKNRDTILESLGEGKITAKELVEQYGKTPAHFEQLLKLSKGSKLTTEKLEDIDVTPRKTTIITDARRCSHVNAIAEILDNIFDNGEKKKRIFEEKKPAGTLEIKMEYYPDADRLVIDENSGGIPFDDMENLVTPGKPGHTWEEKTIGVWGRGFKIAVFSLGKGMEVRTNFPYDDPEDLKSKVGKPKLRGDPLCRGVEYSPKWMTPVPEDHEDYDIFNSWDVAQYLATGVPEGHTHIEIKNITNGESPRKTLKEKGMEFHYKKICKIYGQKLQKYRSEGKRVKITLENPNEKWLIDNMEDKWKYRKNEKEEEDFEHGRPPYSWPDEYWINEMIHPPSFNPYRRTFKYKIKVRDPLTGKLQDAEASMTVTIGIMKAGSRNISGVWLYGNGKFFHKSQEEPFFGKRATSEVPSYHDTLRQLVAVVEFEGNPRVIPWRGPLKEGFEPGEGWGEFKKDLDDILGPYGHFCRKLYGTGIENIFSSEWNSWSKKKRKGVF